VGCGTPYEAVRYLAALIHDVVRAGGDPRSGAALQKALEARPTFQNYLSGGQVHILKDHGSVRALDVQTVRDGSSLRSRLSNTEIRSKVTVLLTLLLLGLTVGVCTLSLPSASG